MKGLTPLILGILGTFLFSWTGLILIPNMQIGHLDPQTDEEGADPYPAPISGMAARGREVYAANGCVYCHSQQVRADYAASDIEREWGVRRSAPRDYLFARPVLLGKSRLGPDLANVGLRAPTDDASAPAAPTGAPAADSAPAPATGASPVPAAAEGPKVAASQPATAGSDPANPATAPTAGGSPATESSPVATAGSAPASSPAGAPAGPPAAANTIAAAPATTATGIAGGDILEYSAAWHHRHLYNPRSIARDSNMPAYRFLYKKQRVGGERSANALILPAQSAPAEGWEIVPTYEAECLVAYLMSLNQSHALNEVKSTATASPPAPGAAVK